MATRGFGSCIRQLFNTPRNTFGLWRQYNTETLPSHDPEENIQLSDLFDDNPLPQCNHAETLKSPSIQNPFYPYPNKSSFRLGEWFWSGGIQKSQESFKQLLNIVGDEKFHPGDVRHTKWQEIDKKLASNVEEGDEDEWMDEDAGWERTPISISVPFHHRMRNPGPQEYIVGDLYHRTLVSVLREKLKSQRDGPLFHYDGFELFWKPTEESADTRVYGELYTSPAFLDAQREVHNSPREPGCNLPRVVVALMFASDATHLTNFGTAKLWPSYLFIGNESKYSRCKPSSHLCNHIAYFQAVSRSGEYYYVSSLSTSAASGCIQGLCLCTCGKKGT